MQILSPGTRIGQYEIASRPMMGGMGVVYFALDHGNDGRPVALKTFRPEFLPDRAARDRFLREGTAWIELGSHPHIVRCYKFEYIDPTAFLVLELIAKEQNMPDASLRSWLIPGRPLPLEQALLFALQIARGMQYATEKIPGFVHRDLKPENILVGAEKLPGTNINRLRVTDFGLVKTISGSDISATDNLQEIQPNKIQFTIGAGTPLYMAPEQWRGESVGVFTDVYAFGCILYEMLVGYRTTEGNTITELQASHCDGRLRQIPITLPKHIVDLVMQCLGLEPTLRFNLWSDVIEKLEYIYTELTNDIPLRKDESLGFANESQILIGWSNNAIGLAYQGIGKSELATDYFIKFLSIMREFGDKHGEITALVNIGNSYTNLGDPKQAFVYHEQALKIAHDIDDISKGTVLTNIGNALIILGDAQKAFENYNQALIFDREIGNRHGEGNTLGNLGNAFLNLGNTQQAIDCYEQCKLLYDELGNQRGLGFALGGLGVAYFKAGDTPKAIDYYKQALLINREIADRNMEGQNLGNLGMAYAQIGDRQQGINCLEQAIEISREIGDRSAEATLSINISLFYAHENNNSRSLVFAQEAEQIWIAIGNTTNIKRANQWVKQLQIRTKPESERAELVKEGFMACLMSENIEAMQLAVEKYPFMVEEFFILLIAEYIQTAAPLENKPIFEKCLILLKEIASQQ